MLRALHAAVGHYTEMGRLGQAARSLRDVAETLEKAGQREEAAEFYERAGDLFAGEEQGSEATKCRLKVAALAAELGRYGVAASLFEDAGRAALESPLLKFGARGHFLNAGICQLCGEGGRRGWVGKRQGEGGASMAVAHRPAAPHRPHPPPPPHRPSL